MSKDERFRTTKILFVDGDETSFQVRQCMAKVLNSLPPIELFHARDATEGLALLDQLKPDVVVLDDEIPGERDLFIDSLPGNHPPIVLRSETNSVKPEKFRLDEPVTYIPKNESLDGIHQTLILVTAIGIKGTTARETVELH
jgi:DNA-binding NarL/FixJ family response regulator